MTITDEQVKAAMEAYHQGSVCNNVPQKVKDMRAALGAADAAAWRPIEEAPKDKHVLVSGPISGGGNYIERCKFYTPANKWPVVFMQDYGEPTHFRHLPEPPK